MAKESMKARERKRERMVARYAKKRKELTEILKSTSSDETIVNQKWDAMMALQKLPANSSKIRLHNRCGLTGRPRGYMRHFGRVAHLLGARVYSKFYHRSLLESNTVY